MRFCPFCSAENVREATHCHACARRLPPLAPRRPRPATGEPPEPRGDRAEAKEAKEAKEGGERQGASLGGISLGPGTRRAGAPAAEPPPPGGPARRESDGRLRSRSAPPLPRRIERDRAEGGLAGARARSPEARLSLELRPEERASSGGGNGLSPAAAVRGESGGESGGEPSEAPPPREREVSANSEPVALEREPAPSELERETEPGAATADSSTDDAAESERRDEPPPTRLGLEAADREVALPSVVPIPETPGPGLWTAARYAVGFARARGQRRRAVRTLRAEIRDDTTKLDEELGNLGRRVRELGIDSAPLADENRAIEEAEARRKEADRECAGLMSQEAEEKAKFADIEAEKQARVAEAEEALDRAQRELASLEAQRRGLRDKRKGIERQQKGYLKAAEDREAQAGKAEIQDSREALRRAAGDLRRDAAGLDPERQDIERRLAALDEPISEASARVDALKAELDSVRRSLGDARDGHRHRLAELDGEQQRTSRELSQAEAEIRRRLITLGTLVNLNRVEVPELRDLYGRVDALRAAIGARSRAIDQLTAECEAYDRGGVIRGVAALAGGGALVLGLVAMLLAIL